MIFRPWHLVIMSVVLGAIHSAHAVTLEVMTYNIRGDFDQGRATDKSEAWNSLSGQHRRDLLLKILTDHQFDLLGVQEAYENQVTDLQDALPKFGFYGVGRDDGAAGGEYSGIFYRSDRFEKLDEGTFWLSETPDQVGSQHPDAACIRIASWLILADRRADDREYFIVNTHWDHQSQPARLHSARVLREKINRLAIGRPVLVMGDLNVNEDNEAFHALTESNDNAPDLELVDAYRRVHPQAADNEATFHGFHGGATGKRIDFVLTTDQFGATAAQIIRTNFGNVFPSDHYPVRVTLELIR